MSVKNSAVFLCLQQNPRVRNSVYRPVYSCQIRPFRNNWEIWCLCYFGNHTKDQKHQQSFLIGSYLHQNTKLLFTREKTFTLIPCLLEEFGSSTISHLFRKHLLPYPILVMLSMLSNVRNIPILQEPFTTMIF